MQQSIGSQRQQVKGDGLLYAASVLYIDRRTDTCLMHYGCIIRLLLLAAAVVGSTLCEAMALNNHQPCAHPPSPHIVPHIIDRPS